MLVIDVTIEHTAILEAKKLGIPIIAVVDTNASPRNLDYIIPGNDDSESSVKFYLEHVAAAIEAGRAKMPKPKEVKKAATVVKAKSSVEKTAKIDKTILLYNLSITRSLTGMLFSTETPKSPPSKFSTHL